MNQSPLVPAAGGRLLTAASVVWRFRGELRVTAIAKATLGFAANGQMPFLAPASVVHADVHARKNPMRSLRAISDLSPHLPRVDVVFQGKAYAPSGQPAERVAVRLGIAGDRGAVLDKRLIVIGDRRGEPGASPDRATPFREMPIEYERAFGGAGHPENPLGVGAMREQNKLPNVMWPGPALSEKVAGYGAIAGLWPPRTRLLRGRKRPAVDAPVVELPDDFDFTYFQAAPEDQRLDALPPRAWVLLDGLNPKHALLQMRLPPMRVAAWLHGAWGDATIELAADTLFIDGDAEHCTVTFRGAFHIASLEALKNAWIGVALETPGEPVLWPSRPAPPAAVTAPHAPGQAPSKFEGTMLIETDASGLDRKDFTGTIAAEIDPRPPARSLPFTGAIEARSEPRVEPAFPIPGAPWSQEARAANVRPAPANLDETSFPLEDGDFDVEEIKPSAPLPAAPAPLPAAPAPAPPPTSAEPRRADPWARQEPAPPPPPPTPAPKPAPPPKRDIVGSLYGRNKKRD